MHDKLRYVMSVDFKVMIDDGMSFKEAENWFKSDECVKEAYEEEWTPAEVQDMFEKCRSQFEGYYESSKKEVAMKQVIVDIIKEGWEKNLPVCDVIANIVSATGLHKKYAQEVFAKLVFTSKPDYYEAHR